jgi:O-antigen ligase
VALTPFQGLMQITSSFNGAKLLGIFLFIIYLARMAVNKQKLAIPSILIPYGLLFIWALISVMWCSNQERALFLMITLLMLFGQIFLFYFACNNLFKLELLLKCYVISSVIFFIYGAFNGFSQFYRSNLSQRLSIGTNENEIGLFMAIGFLFTAYLLIKSKNSFFPKLLWLISMCSFSILVAISQSRAIWIGLPIAFSIFIIVLLISKKTKIKSNIIFIGLACILVTGGLLLSVKYGFISQKLVGRYHNLASLEDPDKLSAGREQIWKEYWKNISGNPFIFLLGNGTGSVFLVDINFKGIIPAVAHNDILQIWANYGIIGLFLYVFFMCRIGLLINRISDFYSKALCFSLLVLYLIYSEFHTTYMAKHFGIIFGVIAAWIGINSRLSENAEYFVNSVKPTKFL